MRLDKFIKDTLDARNRRLADPVLQAKLDKERTNMRESWGRAGNQTLDTTSRIVWNSTGRLAEKVGKGRRSKFDPAGQVHSGAVDSTVAVTQFVGRILAASGRSAWYGIRKLVAK